MPRVAVIDIGTFTSRLAVAEVRAGRVTRLDKRTCITNLGQGVAATGRLAPEAIGRVTSCVAGYARAAAASGAVACATTLTSAARDAENSGELLDGLRELGLKPQVIPGEVEGSLTFSGVVQDAPGGTVLVADSGGGSTELALGPSDGSGGPVDVRSLNVGCRRITDLFLTRRDPPAPHDVDEARGWAADVFAPHAAEQLALARPDRLMVVGGTATTLVAMHLRLVPYDGDRVHLSELGLDTVDGLVASMSSQTEAERAETPGLQPKRAPVILGGAVVLSELMRAFGLSRMTVSEHDLLYGLAGCVGAVSEGRPSPIGWEPELSRR